MSGVVDRAEIVREAERLNQAQAAVHAAFARRDELGELVLRVVHDGGDESWFETWPWLQILLTCAAASRDPRAIADSKDVRRRVVWALDAISRHG